MRIFYAWKIPSSPRSNSFTRSIDRIIVFSVFTLTVNGVKRTFISLGNVPSVGDRGTRELIIDFNEIM